MFQNVSAKGKALWPAMTRRLTINDDIQLFFRKDGTASYSSRSRKLPEQIEGIVYHWQQNNPSHPQFDLSEEWLQSYEAPDRRKEGLIRELRRAYDRFRDGITDQWVDKGVPKGTAEERGRKMTAIVMKEHNPELLPESDTEGASQDAFPRR